jgi:hypothetical protein
MIENLTVKFVVRGQIGSRIFDPDCSTDTPGADSKTPEKGRGHHEHGRIGKLFSLGIVSSPHCLL